MTKETGEVSVSSQENKSIFDSKFVRFAAILAAAGVAIGVTFHFINGLVAKW